MTDDVVAMEGPLHPGEAVQVPCPDPAGRVARPVEELDEDTLRAIANSAVPDEYAHLDESI